ncbi:MAG: DUF1566 domain-containing protein [Treponema sp.]|jgi:TolB-like protein|nr:DUF1566 domain-containing protein [Treponema sp.]
MAALLCAVLSACGGTPAPVSAQAAQPAPAGPAAPPPPDELDAAIRETSDYLNKQLPKGNKLMILNVQSEFPALSEYIIDELIANTVNDRIFSVVDRQQLNTIRVELDFQYSGEVDDETAQSLGRMAGAQIIISGAVSRIGDLYRLRVRALNVQSAQITGQFNRNIPEGPTVSALVRSRATGYGSGGERGASASAAAPVPVPAVVAEVPASAPAPEPAPIPTAPAYKIGDKGPAGGIIFFDKGTGSGGWRYLEAAPAYMETITQWGSDGNRVSGTSVSVGQGKQNTQAIVTVMQQKKENGTAAQACQQLDQGGYTDWFLPSQGELNLMYLNLKKNGWGDFSDGWYWSSSEDASYEAWAQRFSNGEQNMLRKRQTYSVRACRQF